MDIAQLISAAPNLAFGLVCLWFMQQLQKERAAETTRYSASLEKINKLYIELLEKAINAIAANAHISTNNHELLTRIAQELTAVRSEFRELRQSIERFGRAST